MRTNTFKKVLMARKEAAKSRHEFDQLVKDAHKRADAQAKLIIHARDQIVRGLVIGLTNRHSADLTTTALPMDIRLYAQKKSLEPGPKWLLPYPSWMKRCYRYFEGINAKAYLKLLPYDVIIDNIVPYLTVEDILNLRSVDKQFYMLLHSITIWRRIFQNMQGIRLPILRPTFDPLKAEQAYELELLIRRSIRLEREWRLGVSRVRHMNQYEDRLDIIETFVLPGGKFVVATSADALGMRHRLSVYALDVVGGIRLLCRTDTMSLPMFLRATYGVHEGRQGLFVSWTNVTPMGMYSIQDRLAVAERVGGNWRDLGHMYDTFTLHVDLGAAEELLHPSHDPRFVPQYHPKLDERGPFTPVNAFRSHYEIRHVSFFTWKQETYLGYSTMWQGCNAIVFYNVREGPSSLVTFKLSSHPSYTGAPHRVRAWTFCRWTSQLFVVRSVSIEPGLEHQILFEFYDISNVQGPGTHTLSCAEAWTCHDSYQVDKFTISDIERLNNQLPYAHASRTIGETSPLPLYVFASINSQKQQGQFKQHDKKGSAYWIFYPQKFEVPGQAHRFSYRNATMPGDTLVTHTHLNRNHDERILVGVHRTLIVEVDEGIKEAVPISDIKRFEFPDSQQSQLLSQTAEAALQAQTVAAPFPPQSLKAKRSIADKDTIATLMARGGVKSIQWDEGSGKLVITHSGSGTITVLDTGDWCEPLERLAYVWMIDLSKSDPQDAMYVAALGKCVERHGSWDEVIAPVRILVPEPLKLDLDRCD